jgi:hypothetical protein
MVEVKNARVSHTCLANLTASIDSVTVPIWLTFNNKALHALPSTPCLIRNGLVTNKSSPTICVPVPIAAVARAQPLQSF